MMAYANLYKFLILIVCIKINFACTYEKRYDEIEVKQQLQNVTKTRTVCCKGYVRYKEEHNKVVCYPECKNCIKGYCLEPSKCICNDGYMGGNCTEMCADGKWGTNCLGTCNCSNGAQCDHITGDCICAIGWRGKNCEHSTMKERINATNWVRVDDAQEHDKILKNISNVLTKFTESVVDLHKTVSVVKTSNQVDGTYDEKVHHDENSVFVEELIEPARLEPGETSKIDVALTFSQLYPPLLLGISVLLIILTIVLTIKIRKSIISIRKIQQNPAEQFRRKLNNEPISPNPVILARPTQINIPEVVTTTPLQNSAPKQPLKMRQGDLPALPDSNNGNTYDIVQGNKKQPERTTYVPMLPQPNSTSQKTSPIDDPPVNSFVHKKAFLTSYLSMGKLKGQPGGKVSKALSVEADDVYESIKPVPEPEPEPEAEYESVGYYSAP